MSDINAKVSAGDDMPAAKELFVHVLFNFFGNLLFVWTVLHRVADDVFGLELHFGVHLRVKHFDAPLLCALNVFGVHCYYFGDYYLSEIRK